MVETILGLVFGGFAWFVPLCLFNPLQLTTFCAGFGGLWAAWLVLLLLPMRLPRVLRLFLDLGYWFSDVLQRQNVQAFRLLGFVPRAKG